MRVLVADDQPIVREGFRLLLEAVEGFDVVGCASDCAALLRAVNDRRPDVALLDVRLGGEDGLTAVRYIKLRHPAVGVLLFPSEIPEDALHRSVACGVDGIVLKSAPIFEILEAISNVARGDVVFAPDLAVFADPSGLTLREREVLRLLAGGLSNREISQTLFISVATTKSHLENIARKLGTSRRAAAVAEGIRRGLVA